MPRTKKNFAVHQEKLIQIALDKFLEKGYEQTTIADLQKAFGLTKGGIYHYFSSKEAILDAAIAKGIGELVEELHHHVLEQPEEARLIYLLFSDATNSLTNQLILLARSGKSSFVMQKLREQRIRIPIPYVAEIIKQYVDSGFYTCAYPEEMAEILLLLVISISDAVVLRATDGAKQTRAVDAVLSLWDNCVKPPKKHLDDFREHILRFYEQNRDFID